MIRTVRCLDRTLHESASVNQVPQAHWYWMRDDDLIAGYTDIEIENSDLVNVTMVHRGTGAETNQKYIERLNQES